MANVNEYLSKPALLDFDEKHYGLPIVWELVQDRASQVGASLTQQSIACLTEILK